MAFSLVRLMAAFRGAGNAPTEVSAANPMPVTANAGTNLNTSALALEAGNLAAIKTALELIDNAIAGNEMQVDVVTLPAVNIQSLTSPSSKGFTIGTSSGALAGTPAGAHEIVFVAHPDNTGIVYIATRSDVTTKTTIATMGVPLAAGMTFRKYVPASTTWYAIADKASQILAADWGAGV